jgi:hypothetical protein
LLAFKEPKDMELADFGSAEREPELVVPLPDVEVQEERHAGEEDLQEEGPEVWYTTPAKPAPFATQAPADPDAENPAQTQQSAPSGKSKGSKKKGAADSGREYDQATRWSQHEIRILIAAKVKSDMVSSSEPRAKTRSRNEK